MVTVTIVGCLGLIMAILVGPSLATAINPPPPTLVPPPTREPIGWAYVSGVEPCPENPEYGLLVAPGAHLYSDPDIGPDNVITLIPHGTKVDAMDDNCYELWRVCVVRYEGVEGYVQTMMLVHYNPADGVRPNPDYCIGN